MELEELLLSRGGRLRDVTRRAAEFRFQVLLSEVVTLDNGKQALVRHAFRSDTEYFYPASAIKLCAAVAALEMASCTSSLTQSSVQQSSQQPTAAAAAEVPTRAAEITADPPLCARPLSFLPLRHDDHLQSGDASNLNGSCISIAHDIRKLFLVSDNESFNRLFSLVGHRRLNQTMWDLGLTSTALRHRLSVNMTESENLLSPPVHIGVPRDALMDNAAADAAAAASSTPASGAEAAMAPEARGTGCATCHEFCLLPKRSRLMLPPTTDNVVVGTKVGKAYIDAQGNKVEEPLDFSRKNRMSLADLHTLLILIMRPDLLETKAGAQLQRRRRTLLLDEGHRRLLLDAMSAYPGQSHSPKYDAKDFPDDYCKFYLPGLCRVRPKNALRIYNKIGQAYGFTIDNAYVHDVELNREFFLSMVLYTNANAVLNDDRYEYGLAYAVAADVAEAVASALWRSPRGLLLRVPSPSDDHAACSAPPWSERRASAAPPGCEHHSDAWDEADADSKGASNADLPPTEHIACDAAPADGTASHSCTEASEGAVEQDGVHVSGHEKMVVDPNILPCYRYFVDL